MKPHPAPKKPDLDFPELQANWSYWGHTQPQTVFMYDETGTKVTVSHTAPARGVKPKSDMEMEDTRLF